jgi:hypothetical protein
VTQNWQEGGTREDQYQKEMLDEEKALQVPLLKLPPCPSKICDCFQTNLVLKGILFEFKWYLVWLQKASCDQAFLYPRPPTRKPKTLNSKPQTPNPKPQTPTSSPNPSS